MSTTLQRTTFEIPRASEYFDANELEKTTGQRVGRFGVVVVKELVDNTLDACEAAGVTPRVCLTLVNEDGRLRVSVEDNGIGIPADVVRRILNFETRTSDKLFYRAPTRGLQGNALKTIIGIPYALGVEEPVIIEAQGTRHEVRPKVDPAGQLRIDHQEIQANPREGTLVSLLLPGDYLGLEGDRWARAFCLFNPHALVQIADSQQAGMLANNGAGLEDLYKCYAPTVEFPGGWRKFLPTDLTSP